MTLNITRHDRKQLNDVCPYFFVPNSLTACTE